MFLLQSSQNTDNGFSEAICRFVRSGRHLGVLSYDGDRVHVAEELLESVREAIRAEGGQEIFFDLEKTGEATLPALFGEVLDERRRDRPFRVDLPVCPDGLSKSHSPFIARAILWQRLCDRLIEDEEPGRPTLLVLNRFDSSDAKMRHDLARLIRFHQFHRIRRSFLLTLRRDHADSPGAELLDFVEQRFEL